MFAYVYACHLFGTLMDYYDPYSCCVIAYVHTYTCIYHYQRANRGNYM